MHCKEFERSEEENLNHDCFKLSSLFSTIEKPLYYVVKKKIQFQDEIYLFEMRTVPNDENKVVYQFEGYNLENAEAMKTLILTPSKFDNILDSFDYQDILPFYQKDKDINNFLDFVKFFVIPFMNVQKNNLISHIKFSFLSFQKMMKKINCFLKVMNIRWCCQSILREF